jgi:hypothetical protein
MELSDNTLTVSRELSELDKDVLEFTQILDACEVDYVIVSGYVAILTGRSRSTEDIDIILESLSETETEQLVTELKDRGYWGMAMPLDEMYSMLRSGLPKTERCIRTSRRGSSRMTSSEKRSRTPSRLCSTKDRSRSARSNSKSHTNSGSRRRLTVLMGNGKDFEDALHLYLTFEERFNTEQLEMYVSELGVEEYYAELRGV